MSAELTRLTSSKFQPLDQRQAQVIWGQGFIRWSDTQKVV